MAYHFHHSKQINISECETGKDTFPYVGDHGVQFVIDPEQVLVGSSPCQEWWYEIIAPFFEICAVFWEWEVYYLIFLFDAIGEVLRDLWNATAQCATHGMACCTASCQWTGAVLNMLNIKELNPLLTSLVTWASTFMQEGGGPYLFTPPCHRNSLPFYWGVRYQSCVCHWHRALAPLHSGELVIWPICVKFASSAIQVWAVLVNTIVIWDLGLSL